MDKLPLNQETMDILVANVIPTTKYFESRFDHMQYQIDEIKKYQEEFKKDVDKRFEQVDKRFEQVDKRFEQIDKRFEQVDKRFQSLENKIVDLTLEIKELSKKQETTIRDYIIERDRHYDAKFNNLRNFNIAVISIVTGFALKFFGVLDKIF
jgi:chromosome segregation ATPase